MASERREAVIDRLAEACAEGAQAYWVCPSIDSEDGQLVSATFTHQHLSKRLADHSVGLVHGRMSSQEKQTVMREFKEGRSVSLCPRR